MRAALAISQSQARATVRWAVHRFARQRIGNGVKLAVDVAEVPRAAHPGEALPQRAALLQQRAKVLPMTRPNAVHELYDQHREP